VKCVGLLGSLSSLGSSHGESSRADRWRKVASAGGQPGRLGNWLGLLLPFGQVPQVSPLNQHMLLRSALLLDLRLSRLRACWSRVAHT
jgi:hypothetical protein